MQSQRTWDTHDSELSESLGGMTFAEAEAKSDAQLDVFLDLSEQFPQLSITDLDYIMRSQPADRHLTPAEIEQLVEARMDEISRENPSPLAVTNF